MYSLKATLLLSELHFEPALILKMTFLFVF